MLQRSPHRLFISLLTGLLISCSDSGSNSIADMPDDSAPQVSAVPTGRLPNTVEPTHYDLHLQVDPRADSFSGRTVIHLTLHDDTQAFYLHGNELDVVEVFATTTSGASIAASYRQVDPVGVAEVTFAEVIPAGDIELNFGYSAPFNTSLEGLHKITNDGNDYAFTQFEATSARLAFPSFDEPAFKVPFDITLQTPADHRAITNTPAVRENTQDGWRTTQFATTKPLPTYLLAFAVGPLDIVEWEPLPATAVRPNAVPLRGVTAKGKGSQIHYALQHTREIVTALEEYFGIPYPYAKLDILALPDFAAGAMENAGAITYREQLLLMDENAPALQKIRYASVHTHELAHQWFGDLVTPVWWDDIWLNEAFATWMAGSTMHRIDPDAGYKQRMLNSALNSMQLDQLVSARQIRQPITQHQEIGAAFDGITYQKGGAVLSMLEQFVGPENFRQGIHNYLTQYRFGNATATEFVQAIAETRKDLQQGIVEKAFFSFLEQPGTPMVSINWQCNGGTTHLAVQQQRYLPLGSTGNAEQQWLLPLCVTAVNGNRKQTHCQIIAGQNEEMTLNPSADDSSCPDTIIPNAEAAGYYRYSLDAKGWQSLLNNSQLSERELLSAADSLSAAFYSGQLGAKDFITLLPPLLTSDNVQVLSAPLGELALMRREMISKDQQQRFAQQLDKLYEHVYARVGLDKPLQSADDIQLRNTILGLYAKVIKDPDLREVLYNKAVAFTGYTNDNALHPDALDINIRELALNIAANKEGEPFVNLLLDHFKRSNDALLREEILRAATATDDPAVLDDLRALSLTETLRDNEVRQILAPLMNDVDKRDATWQWLRANMDAVIARQPAWTKGAVIGYASGFCSMDRYNEIKQELAEKFQALESGPRTLANTLERIEICTAVVKHHRSQVQQLIGE